MGLEMASCESYLQKLGFVDITVQRCYFPVGGWPEGSKHSSVLAKSRHAIEKGRGTCNSCHLSWSGFSGCSY